MKDHLQNIRSCFEINELIVGLNITAYLEQLLLEQLVVRDNFLISMTFLFSVDLYLSSNQSCQLLMQLKLAVLFHMIPLVLVPLQLSEIEENRQNKTTHCRLKKRDQSSIH